MDDLEKTQPDTPVDGDHLKRSEEDPNEILMGDEEISDQTEVDAEIQEIKKEDVGDLAEELGLE